MKRINPWHILAGIALVTFIACAGSPPATDPNPPPPPATSAETVSLAKFNQLHQGMSFDEATSALGSKGVRSSSSGPFETYTFRGEGCCASAVLTFQDGRLTSFTQMGLK